MTGTAFAFFYAIAGIYLALLADVYSRKKLISISIVAWSLFTALTGAAQNFLQLLLVRVGIGVGEASVIPTANALIADYYRPDRRPFALTIFTSRAMIGVMTESFFGGTVAECSSCYWRIVLL